MSASVGFRAFRGQSKVVSRLIDRILSQCSFVPMQTVSYTEDRNGLAALIEAANRDREPITITRNGSGAVVLLASEEFAAME